MDNNYDELYNKSYGDLSNFSTDNTLNDIQDQFNGIGGDNNEQSSFMPGQPYMQPTQYSGSVSGLDPKIVKLTRAIRQVESGGNYGAMGKSGEIGAYQFMPTSWKSWAKEYLGDENAQPSKENQNQVAYRRIESLAKQGYSPDQIASIWNSGQPEYQGKRGVNKFGVEYDVPAYVNKVMGAAMAMPKTAEASQPTEISKNTQTPTTENKPEDKSVGGFIGNLGSSALNFGKGLANVALHPIDTVTNLGKLALGGADLLGSQIGVTSGQSDGANLARNLGSEYADRYGGASNIGETLYKDPVGVAADLATLLSGGAAAASKLGKVGKLGELGKLGQASNVASKLSKASKVGEVLTTASKVTDPLQLAIKGASKLGASKAGTFLKETPTNILGITTGEGGGTFRQIYDAAKNNRKGAVEAMRGGLDAEQIVSKLDSAVGALKSEASSYWNKLGLDNMKGTLDVSPIFRKMDEGLDNLKVVKNADGTLDFSRSKLRFDKKAQADIQQIVDTMSDYGTRKGDRLPSGVDTMKQAFQTLYSENRDSRGFVEGMRKTTRDILGQVPGYDKYARDYGQIQDMLTQLKTEMSAGNKNAAQTFRKLVNTFKQRNTEGRRAILGALNEKGVSDIIDNIAGYGAKDVFKQSLFSNLGAGGALFSGNISALPAFSPRIVGETVNAIGKTVGKAGKIQNKASNLRGANVVKYIGGQVYNKNKATRTSTLSERMKEK